MSRAALNRQLQHQLATGTLPPANPFDVLTPYLKDEAAAADPKLVPFHGDAQTCNMEGPLAQNIVTSAYYRHTLLPLETFEEVREEAWRVKHVEAWAPGGATARAPSQAFSIVHRLGVMRVTRKQLSSLLNAGDNPYLRAIGALLLRFTCPPPDLFSWLEPYLDDTGHVFTPGMVTGGRAPPSISFGEWLRTVLLAPDSVRYGSGPNSCLMPRIPIPIARGLPARFAAVDEDAAAEKSNLALRARSAADPFGAGARVKARWSEDGQFYDAKVDGPAAKGDILHYEKKVWVTYTESEDSELRSIGQLRAVEGGGASGSAGGREAPPPSWDARRPPLPPPPAARDSRSRSRSRDRSARRSWSRDRGDYRREDDRRYPPAPRDDYRREERDSYRPRDDYHDYRRDGSRDRDYRGGYDDRRSDDWRREERDPYPRRDAPRDTYRRDEPPRHFDDRGGYRGGSSGSGGYGREPERPPPPPPSGYGYLDPKDL